MSRVGEAARGLGVPLDAERAESLDAAVTAVEAAVGWKAWDEGAPFPPWPRSPAGGFTRTAPAVWLGPQVRPRPLSEGGPYVAVLDGTDHRQGPLAGWPVAVKDIVSVAGAPLRGSSKVRRDAPPQESDATVVDGLRRLGASIVGITAMHEFAFGVTGVNDHTGTPENPRVPGAIPGGSSSGSAVAVAEGSARVALGTDTGGSVRIPAALCGVVGYKPSLGLYPTDGVFPLAPTLDHVGLIAGTVADVRTVHAALGFPEHPAAPPARVGVDPAELEAADGEIAAAVASVLRLLERHGSEVVEVAWPDRGDAFAVSTVIMFAEAATVHRATLERRAGDYGEDVRGRLVQGSAIRAWAYVAARRRRRELRSGTMAVLAEVDCVLGPTVGVPAPAEDEARTADVAARLVEFTRLANVTGVPALSIPMPSDGAPYGLHVVAAADARLLAVGDYVEDLVGRDSG